MEREKYPRGSKKSSIVFRRTNQDGGRRILGVHGNLKQLRQSKAVIFTVWDHKLTNGVYSVNLSTGKFVFNWLLNAQNVLVNIIFVNPWWTLQWYFRFCGVHLFSLGPESVPMERQRLKFSWNETSRWLVLLGYKSARDFLESDSILFT